jgi:cell division protein FtsX
MTFLQIAASPLENASDVFLELGKIGNWIQAVGIIVILWIIFQIIILINNRIRRKKLYSIEERLESIEKKIDKISKK